MSVRLPAPVYDAFYARVKRMGFSAVSEPIRRFIIYQTRLEVTKRTDERYG